MQNPYSKYQKQGPAKVKVSKKKKLPIKSKIKKSRGGSSKGVPVSIVALCAFGLALSFYVFMCADEILSFTSRINIDFSRVHAGEKEKTAGQSKGKQEKAAPLPVGSASGLGSKVNHLTMKNASVSEALASKSSELDKKERSLARLEEDLQNQRVEIEKQLKELGKMRREISSVLDKKVKTDQTSVDKLVGMYSNMKPQNAANILTQINEDLAIKVLGKMKKQSAAAILNFIEPRKAQDLSERYAGIKK